MLHRATKRVHRPRLHRPHHLNYLSVYCSHTFYSKVGSLTRCNNSNLHATRVNCTALPARTHPCKTSRFLHMNLLPTTCVSPSRTHAQSLSHFGRCNQCPALSYLLYITTLYCTRNLRFILIYFRVFGRIFWAEHT